MRWRLVAIAIGALGLGSVIAYGQSVGPNSLSQFNTSGAFGGIAGVTSDGANVGFATSSHLYIYGFGSGNCLKSGAGGQIADAGSPCGGSGSPGGVNTQVQFNTFGTFGGITGATSNGSNISFTTNSLVINGQAISNVSGTTGTLATVSGSLASNCVKADGNGNLVNSGSACGGTSATNIAAGTNITTSGTTSNVTVNVVATPSFTTVIASGNITAGTAQFTGQLTGTSAVFQTATVNNLTPTGPNCLQETGGVLQATNTSCATQTATPSIAAGTNITTSGTAANTTINVVATPSFTTVIASGNITAGTAQFTGLLTGTNAVFQTVTVNNLTPTGPNCLQETGGVLQATNVPCASSTATISIAAGNNIVTSGTSSNVTVTATPTGPSGAVQFDNSGIFGGDSGFQYAGGASGIATLTLGTITTTNGRALSLIGAWSNSTTTFAAPLFVNITTNTSSANTTSGFGVGSRLVDIQATSISVLSISPSGSLSSAALQSGATQCLQASTGGLIFGTALPCATQTSTPSIAAGSNITTSGTSSNTTINVVATPSFTTVIATSNLTASTVLGVVGWLTAPGINAQTLTLASNLTGTTANFSSNLTANIAQFAGFITAGGASLSGLTIQTATFSSNLTGTTANFSSNLTANIAQFAGFLSAGGASLSGLTIQTATFSSNLTGTTANLSSNLTAQIAQFPGWLTAAGANVQSITIATNLTGSQANFSSTLTASIYTGTGTGAGALAFITPGISEFGLGSPAAANTGWINWGGESRLAADKGLNISNAGLTPTTLSVNVQGGRTYSIDADLYVTLAVAATSGIAVSLSGTYGSTDTHYFGYVVDGGSNTSAAGTSNPIRGATLASAKNTIVGNVSLSGTTGYVALKGTVSVQTAGTLLIAAATVNTQTAANGVSLTRGSRILVHDMP